MVPQGSSQTLLSPAELSFLHSSLSSTPPIRPDLRTPTQFRPLVAETDILPSTNGSARICFSDGTEAIVGIKAEVEKTPQAPHHAQHDSADTDTNMEDDIETKDTRSNTTTTSIHLDLSIEIPNFRDDDSLPIFLSSMLTETLLSTPYLSQKLHINARWHWKLYIDVLLLSPPLSYPLPLLSLTTHLALLNTALPRLKSDPGDDPLFDNDWAAAEPLYAKDEGGDGSRNRPPITLLVMTVNDNIVFDPSREELAVADAVLAVTVVSTSTSTPQAQSPFQLLTMRTIDPPSRLTPPGVPDATNPATAVGVAAMQGTGQKPASATAEAEKEVVWSPPRGGIKRALVARIVKAVVEKGGVGEEVLEGLAAVET